MEKKFQAASKQIANLIINATPKDNISYHLMLSINKGMPIGFGATLWDSATGEEALESCYIVFDYCDTDNSITKKITKIKNIINGEIDPFEEARDERK